VASAAVSVVLLNAQVGGTMSTFAVTATEMYAIFSILALFSVIGSLGNAVVLYVFSTANDRLVSTLFIIVLAVVDLSTCLVVIPFTVVVEFLSYNVRLDALCRLYQFLITSNIPFSALIMAAIAVDRYLCICHPFAHLLTPRRARIVVLVLAAIAAAFGVIAALTHSVYQRAAAVVEAARDSGNRGAGAAAANYSAAGDEAVYTGQCKPTDLVLSTRFAQAFHKCYTATFVVCVVVVAVLYSLIYRSVLRQRRKRQLMRAAPPIRAGRPPSVQQPPVVVETTTPPAARDLPTAAGEGRGGNGGACVEASPEAIETVGVVNPVAAVEKRAPANPAAAAERALQDRIANIKTAATLFVVTLVFVVSFFPALAMTLYLVPYSMTVFYLYFANNVANPVIYSFMNADFRQRLARIAAGRRTP